MTVTSNVSGIYAYNGSLASLDLGSITNVSIANFGSGPQGGQFVDNNGQLSQADDGLTTFSLNGGPAEQIDFLGSGTIATLGILGIRVDPRPVAVFSAGGQVYFYAPQGLPLLSGLLASIDLNPNGTFNLPAEADGKVDGLDAAQTMNVGFTDLQGDQITEGSDLIFANGGSDTVNAGGGNDTVFGGAGADSLSGQSGDDVLSGDAGHDTLSGGLGNDLISGDDGNDTIFGGADNDTIDAGSGLNFVSADGGDDTVIVTDGVGSAGSIFDGGEGTDTLDLRESGSNRIVYDENTRQDGTIFFLDSGGAETGLSSRFVNFERILCFATGTRFITPNGMVAVEDLRVGERIATHDGGSQPIRWIGTKFVPGSQLRDNALLQPVLIRAGALGHGLPERDLLVTRQHRILVKSDTARQLFGAKEILVPAKDLIGLEGIIQTVAPRGIEYWHILLDQHQILMSECAPTESLFLGPQTEQVVGPEAMEEIRSIFPDIEDVCASLSRQEVRGKRARSFLATIKERQALVLDIASRQEI